jgi:hypothetical protein
VNGLQFRSGLRLPAPKSLCHESRNALEEGEAPEPHGQGGLRQGADTPVISVIKQRRLHHSFTKFNFCRRVDRP